MEWWEIMLKNLPTIILCGLALFFIGAEIIKGLNLWREESNRIKAKKQEAVDKDNATQATLQEILSTLKGIDQRLGNLEVRMDAAEARLQGLTESDMHDIKAWIVNQYHKFYVEQGWIDNYSAETIERRYEDYIKEGGNSYVKELVNRLRTLPMDPPAHNE